MTTTLRTLVVVAAVGSGVVAGVAFAFSTFIVPALRRLDPVDGARSMQEINRVAVKPPLMIAIFGTGILAVVLIVAAARSFGDRPSPWVLAAAVTYLVTSVIVTIAGNEPQNKKLEALDVDGDGSRVAAVWDTFASVWTAWNHVRTVGCIVATALFAVALVLDGQRD